MDSSIWQFHAMDSLFFGSGKPMNAGESSWIDSQFPPTGLTLQGAVRTAVLYYTNADIEAFKKGDDCLPNNGGSLRDEIGCANSLGKLDLTGPFFQRDQELLFPVPLDLMVNKSQRDFLKPGKPIHCDLGHIRLPAIANGGGYKTVENAYLSRADMAKLLRGEKDDISLFPLFADQPEDIALADKEPKVGLARNNQSRTHQDGMLFAIAPVRLRQNVSLVLQVQGISRKHTPQQRVMQRLGGEGKLANISVSPNILAVPNMPDLKVDGGKIRFKLVFTQPALMPEQRWLPKGFAKNQKDGVDLWTGSLKDCDLDIISACIGKPLKLGGWDLVKHESKPHKAYIPAGSVYFCEAAAQFKENIQQLHNSKLGKNTEYGFGHVLVGCW